eukprot:5103165-Pleurochrysis_carterae.AAC.1
MPVEEVRKVYVMDIGATPSRSEARVSPAGTTPSRAASGCSRRVKHCHSGCKCVCISVEIRGSSVTGPASALTKLAQFSSGHRMNSSPYDVAFIVVNKGTARSLASRCAKALAFVALVLSEEI